MNGGDTIPNEFRYFRMGLWQVNGSAPQILSIISSIVLSELQVQGVGTHFRDSFTTEISQLVGFSYAYYCNMFQSENDVEATRF